MLLMLLKMLPQKSPQILKTLKQLRFYTWYVKILSHSLGIFN